jgi:hypothetical protein
MLYRACGAKQIANLLDNPFFGHTVLQSDWWGACELTKQKHFCSVGIKN